jgi:adhesin transport system outer membrane protein
VDATREVLVVYNEQLSLGKRTLLDLLDVQNELLRAHAADVTGEFTELLAGYRLMASLGRLLPSLGIKPE